MKIRELFENVGNLPQIHISVETSSASVVQYRLGRYTSRLEPILKEYGLTNIQISSDQEYWEIEATIPNTNVLKYCEPAYRSAMDIAEKLEPDEINYAQFQVTVDWPPAFPLHFSEQCPELIVTLHQKASIKGIDKLIQEVDFISFRNSENISGFLNILKIKELSSIEFSGKVPNTVDTIINKHLKDKNIIACQEELFQNNLDEYATL